MPNYDKILAQGNVIGSLVMAVMDSDHPDVEAVLHDFRHCLNDYDAWAEDFWTGQALDIEQVFKVGNEVSLAPAKNDSEQFSAVVARCPAQGPLTLVHMFQASRFVPIGNTPVTLEPIIEGEPGKETFGEPVPHVIGPSGILEIPECDRGQRYRITFFPNVTTDHVKALYASYQLVIVELEGWLKTEWNEFQPLWKEFSEGGFVKRFNVLQQAEQRGFERTVYGLWDSVKQVFDLLADLRANSEKLLEFLTEAELEQLLKASSEAIAKGLMILSDEPLLLVYTAAFTSWLRMMPPQYRAEVMGEMRASVLINFLLAAVTGGLGVGLHLSGKALHLIRSERAREWLQASSQRLGQLGGDSLNKHADALKPVVIAGRGSSVGPAPVRPLQITAGDSAPLSVSNPAPIVREKSQAAARLSKYEPHDDASTQSKNPNGDPADSAAQTRTHGCPVSMVTGEELLTLEDGTLDGRLPFVFTRLYRTSAAELDAGLGLGWSHALAHRLLIEGEEVIWIDQENRRTSFPRPNLQRPAIHNSLARAAIYLSSEPDELIVAQPGEGPPFLHFRNGHLIALSDRYDNRLTIQRNIYGDISRLDNGAQRSLRLRYEHRHLVAIDYQSFHPERLPDEAWRTEQTLATYRYDARWRLIEATNAAGESERYDYDDRHIILQRQLAGGASFYWEWQGVGLAVRCARHWASFAQMDSRYTWSEDGSVIVQNLDGSQEVYVHDERARLVRQVDPDGGEHLKAYDEQGRLIAEQDPLGAVTEYRYDEVGRLVALIPPEGEPTSYEYRNGFLHARQRGKAVWTYRRNTRGDVIVLIEPEGRRTEYAYDAHGQLLATYDPDGGEHRFTWSRLGQLTEEILPDGSRRCFSYDALGRLLSRQDEHGALTHYQWDAVGRLLQVTLPNGATRTWRYNAYGKVTAECDEQGRLTRYEYADDLHLISRRLNPDGSELKYRYDSARLLLTEIENESGEKYQLDYTPGGLIRQETGFDGQRTGYAYDLNGHLLEKTEFGADGNQRITAYQRDTAGRLLRKTLPDGATIDYRYDALGRLVSVDDGHWPLAYEYDAQDRLVVEHQGWATLRYRYDSVGRLIHCRLPDHSTLDYRHAPGGALFAIDLNGTCLTEHRYKGGRERQRQQGLLLSDYTYDEQGRLKAQTVWQTQQQQLFWRDYSYSANGNLAALSDTRNRRSYQYDAQDHLLRIDYTHSQAPEHFAHDPAGNLLMMDRPGPTTLKGNRLLMEGDRHYDYDAYGNLARERRGKAQCLITEYRYDSQHRLIGVTTPDGNETSYRYDAFGRRISKTVDSQTTEFIWQGDQVIAESSNSHYQSYVYEPGTFRPLALLEGEGPEKATPFYYHLDHLGTPQELTSHQGEVVWAARYNGYGKLTGLLHGDGKRLEQPLRFQGQYHDRESGLHYNRHRYYNPETGRYLTADPSKLKGGLNAYRYTLNPTGWVDPLGLVDCPGNDGCKKPAVGEQDPAAKVGVDEGSPPPPAPPKPDKWSRHPKSIQDQMALESAKADKGLVIIEELDDPNYYKMEKMELKVKSKNRNDSVVHYVRDPSTGKLMDFKFKKHSTDDIKPWGNDPSVPPGIFEK
ncbi:RHS repeat-associated core domain-containing protein [Pseudomonas sp. P9_35]|uniref:RHS repeat-associated core domain-containing protein n=1 Tax=unclassified Pseudomonas TaxID=196821 RepID=UPI002A365E26|nr:MULTISPECIES: RHS repeat-associated core domain-containing protein [unclassified Pseudomonas]WPN62907.1 RHS repeat-associated core domain-containing protein [Pseudomonas sp. P9_32]WPN68660.1 RHS repeat-associated core domain-containing protein [Pseudomonas sp. P9_35]